MVTIHVHPPCWWVDTTQCLASSPSPWGGTYSTRSLCHHSSSRNQTRRSGRHHQGGSMPLRHPMLAIAGRKDRRPSPAHIPAHIHSLRVAAVLTAAPIVGVSDTLAVG